MLPSYNIGAEIPPVGIFVTRKVNFLPIEEWVLRLLSHVFEQVAFRGVYVYALTVLQLSDSVGSHDPCKQHHITIRRSDIV